ncbi:MAG: hypothetical protein HYY04_18815 [Chloroflexi bacterium]|nr:hypothetical protein [Chloroflexota bacterium]
MAALLAALAALTVAPLRGLAESALAAGEAIAERIGIDVIRPPTPVDRPGFLVHNGLIGLKHNDEVKGMLILYRYNSTVDDWQPFNSIVPLAKVGWFSNNAEFQRPEVTATVLQDEVGYKRVRYHFSPFANGAHFSLDAELHADLPEVRISVVPEPDSGRIAEFSLQTTIGFVDTVTEIETASATFRAAAYTVRDGFMVGGLWLTLRPSGKQALLRGRELTQYIAVERTLSGDDRLEVEVRRTPWLRGLPDPGENWFELVRLIRRPFTADKRVWRFGLLTSPSP